MQHKALAGVKVLEYARLVAAPYCGKLFADLGAEVIKIETPQGGDVARARGPFFQHKADPEHSILFTYLNTNKYGITLDLNTAEGMNSFRGLVQDADILIEDAAPRQITDMGIAYEELAEINPQLIVTSITAFGQSGPYADYKTYPLNTTFSGGLGYSTPGTAAEPVKPGGMMGECACGLYAATATLAALYAQRITGVGQHVDISKQEAIIGLMRSLGARYANMSESDYAKTIGQDTETIPVIPCKDGYLVLSMPETHQWHGLVRMMGSPEWAQNKLYDDDFQRTARFKSEIMPRLLDWTMERTKDEIYHQAQTNGCPITPVMSAEDVINSEQLQARAFFVSAQDANGDEMTYPGAPYTLSKTPWALERPAPKLGEHNELHNIWQNVSAVHEPARKRQVKYPLEGVRIVDFTWAWAGAHAMELMAMLGAEVIKVESRSRIDHARVFSITTGEFYKDVEQSSTFNDLNLNKRSATLNLRHPQGVELAKKLIAISDVTAQNMRPGVMDRLGLGYDVLKEIRPDVITLSSSALGMTGPQREYIGYATNFAATSGLTHMTGHPDGPPLLAGGEIDLLSAVTSAHAILVALIHRQRTGEGQHVDLSSSEVTSVLLGDVLMDCSQNGSSPYRKGNQDELMAPHNCYPCRGQDKWISIAIATEEEWQAFCGVTGHPEWVVDIRFINTASRWQNQADLDRLIAGWTTEYSHYEAMHVLQEAGIAAIPYFSSEDLCTDPHLRDRGYWLDVEHPVIGTQTVAAPPWKLSKTPAEIIRHGPLLGEHNDYVFGELLGLSNTEVRRLMDEQAIY